MSNQLEAASPILEWYNGKSLFITGGTGFMGKVLVEKLLYTCCQVKSIYLLMRSKRGKSPKQRIVDMWKLPMFERLRNAQPEAINKIIPLNGDLYSDKLGLSGQDYETIGQNVDVIIHLGATLKLDANLRDAVEQNTNGTARVIDLAKKCRKLKAFLHYSTAFCSADIEEFEEKVYDCKDDPRKVIELCQWMNPQALEKATPEVIAPHPNTYTYSKRLAEYLVQQEFLNLPTCILRPSIVTPAWSEPCPGWVDSLNGPMGLLVGAGKGVIRSMHVTGDNKAHVVPVDTAACAAIVIAHKVATSPKPKDIPVFNMTQDAVVPATFREVLDKGRAIIYKYPFEGQIWYPDGDMRSNKFVHTIYCLLLHWLPAILIDTILFVLRQKTFMIRLNKKIHHGLELLQFFTTRQWLFKSENFLALYDDLNDFEKKLFPMDFTIITIEEYLELAALGARQYCMKEDLSTLPRARIHQKVLYVIHKLFVFSLYYFAIYYLMSLSPATKQLYNSVVSSTLGLVF